MSVCVEENIVLEKRNTTCSMWIHINKFSCFNFIYASAGPQQRCAMGYKSEWCKLKYYEERKNHCTEQYIFEITCHAMPVSFEYETEKKLRITTIKYRSQL